MSRDCLSELQTALTTAFPSSEIAYGTANQISDTEWNYIVYGRESYRPSGTNTVDHTDVYFVIIVREDYVPEEDIQTAIDAVKSIPGFRIDTGEMPYNYSPIGNTKQIAESITLRFTRAARGR